MKQLAAVLSLALCFPAAAQNDPLVDLLQRRDYDRDAILRQFPPDSSPDETRDDDSPDAENAAGSLYDSDKAGGAPQFLRLAPLPSAALTENIALVLPTLSEGIAGQVAQNFYRGCIHAAGGAAIRLYAFNGAREEAVQHYAAAVEQGAAVVVGPMLKKNVGALLAAYPQTPSRTLLLQPGGGDGYFVMTLDAAREAADLAIRLSEHFDDALIVEQPGARGARLRAAFEEKWTAIRAAAPGRFVVRDENRDWKRLFEMLKEKSDKNAAAESAPKNPAVVFVAGDGGFAEKARGFTPQRYFVFTVSTANTGVGGDKALLQENLGFMEMPWFVGLDETTAALDSLSARTLPFVRQRFFALGADACRAARKSALWREGWFLRGLAGEWRLQNGVFIRAGQLAVYRAGRLDPL